ncbi:MAG: VIT domain-containing protein [Fimbriimonadaceae bacterium]
MAVQAQNLTSVYNRDTGQSFALKKVHAFSIVRGPLVKTTTTYLFENPYTKLTEASFNFELPTDAVLGGFGYWYKDEFVPGILMDKQMAWFIYTAITSRNRDPGIMEMTSNESFHAQIYPLAIGYALRIQLTSISYGEMEYDRMHLTPPGWPGGDRDVEKTWKVDGGGRPVITSDWRAAVSLDWQAKNLESDIFTSVVAERWKDGRVYVAGTAMGALGRGTPTVAGLRSYHSRVEGRGTYGSTVRFCGIATGPSIAVRQGRNTVNVSLGNVTPGSDVAKVWAQAEIVDGYSWNLLDFSLKYQVPSNKTALLAVPTEEKRLFEQKRKEYLAKLRAEKAEMLRRDRAAKQSAARSPREADLNWRQSRGGDPQIMFEDREAERVLAVLPDGRVLPLRSMGNGWWTVNFEIPADATEGTYVVRLIAIGKDGSRREEKVEYVVDRTAPVGTATWEQGSLVVRSEPGLALVEAFTVTGRRIVVSEVEPGVYKSRTAIAESVAFVLAKDGASNKTRLQCSPRP